MPCYLVRHFHVLQFNVLHFQRPQNMLMIRLAALTNCTSVTCGQTDTVERHGEFGSNGVVSHPVLLIFNTMHSMKLHTIMRGSCNLIAATRHAYSYFFRRLRIGLIGVQ